MSLGLVACGGGGSDGSGGTSSPSVDQRLGTYSAEITDSGGLVRSLDLIVESDTAVTSGTPESIPFIQLRDSNNLFSRYRHMRNKDGWVETNQIVKSDYETQNAHYHHSVYDSLQDCLDNISGTGALYEKILISQPKFSGGGFGTTLTACKLKD